MEHLALSIPGIGGTPSLTPQVTIKIQAPTGIPTGGLFTTGQNVIATGLNVLFVTAIVLSIASFIWGGISWTTSGGKKEQLEKARLRLTYGVVGLTLVFLSFLIIQFIGDFFGVKLVGQ